MILEKLLFSKGSNGGLGWVQKASQLPTYLGCAWSHGILQKGSFAVKKEESRVTIPLAAQVMQGYKSSKTLRRVTTV